jgi:hypothetical protein
VPVPAYRPTGRIVGFPLLVGHIDPLEVDRDLKGISTVSFRI